MVILFWSEKAYYYLDHKMCSFLFLWFDAVLDAMYLQGRFFCFRFTCDKPHYVIKVGRGMNWGVMANQTTPLVGEQCKYSVGDCYVHDVENPFLYVSYVRRIVPSGLERQNSGCL